MNEAIVCRPNPAKTLALTEAVCRELRNFLIYRRNPEILNERARHQPKNSNIEKIPADVKEIGKLLGADKRERNRKLFFEIARRENLRAVLVHNVNAQFWVYYFRCGIGLVNLSFFGYVQSLRRKLALRLQEFARSPTQTIFNGSRTRSRQSISKCRSENRTSEI